MDRELTGSYTKMSREPMTEIEFSSIQKMFQARDERNAREAERTRYEKAAGAENYRVQKDASYSRRSSAGGRRLENSSKRVSQNNTSQRRTRLEYVPERDEYRTQRRDVETARRTGKRYKRRHLHSKDAAKAKVIKSGVIAGSVAGTSAALLALLNALLSPAPAMSLNNVAAQNDASVKPFCYQAGRNEYGDTVTISNGSGTIEYDPVANSVIIGDVVDGKKASYAPVERVSDNLIDAMKAFEGFHLEAYVCPGGAWTIGYGHTTGVYEGQTITPQEAKDLLRSDLASCEAHVRDYAEECGVQLTQGQFDALVDFTFNLGVGAFDKSGLVEMIGEGDIDEAAEHIQKYVYTKNKDGESVKLPGLVSRRAAEAEWLYSQEF